MLTALPRATGIGDANGHRTRYCPHVTAPAKQVRAVPLPPAGTAAAEQPRSSPPAPPPSPAAPTQATPAELSCPVLNTPALSRLPCGTCTAPDLRGRLGAGSPRSCIGVPWCRAKLDFFESLTGPVHHSLRRRCIHTASFHSLSSSRSRPFGPYTRRHVAP